MGLAVRLFRDDRRCLLLILPPAILLFALNLGGRDLWAPDEPRTGLIAREILRTGAWAVLQENGGPYLEKPPLTFWMAAAAALPAGRVTEFNVRLPASLAGLCGVALLFAFGRNLYGRRTGTLAAIVLATTHAWFMEARWAHPDMPFAVLLLAAAFAFDRAHRAGGDRRWLFAFHAACGLAVLAKGPLGLLLPWLAAVVFLAAARDWRFLGRTGWAWGVPLALLPAASWLVAWRAAAGTPFPLGEALAGLGRRFTEGVHHPRPFLHLFVALPIEFLPWTLFLPGAVAHTFPRRGARIDRDTLYVWSWIVVILAVFGLSAEKRGVYLLPLLPFLAILMARVWDTALLDWDPSPVGRTIRWGLVALAALAAAAPVVLLPRLRSAAPDLVTPGMLLAGLLLLAAVAALAALRWRGGGAALAVLAGGLAVCHAAVAVAVLPALDRHKSARQFGARIAAATAGGPLAIYPDYRSAYAFYSGRNLATPAHREALRDFLRSAPRAFCLMEDTQLEDEKRHLGIPLEVLDRERVGHRAMLLVAATAGASVPAAPGAADPDAAATGAQDAPPPGS